MLQQDRTDEFVIGTGELHSLRDLCEVAYRSVGLDWRDSVVSDPGLVRPLEPGHTRANAAKAQRVLGWQPTLSFEEMVRKMVMAQLERLRPQLNK